MSNFTQQKLDCDVSGELLVLSEPLVWQWIYGQITPAVDITVPVGFKTDLASIPWFAQWLVPKLGIHNLAAVLHDYLCVIAENRGQRKSADKVFYEALRACKVTKLRARMMYYAVRLDGTLFFRKTQHDYG